MSQKINVIPFLVLKRQNHYDQAECCNLNVVLMCVPAFHGTEEIEVTDLNRNLFYEPKQLGINYWYLEPKYPRFDNKPRASGFFAVNLVGQDFRTFRIHDYYGD